MLQRSKTHNSLSLFSTLVITNGNTQNLSLDPLPNLLLILLQIKQKKTCESWSYLCLKPRKERLFIVASALKL